MNLGSLLTTQNLIAAGVLAHLVGAAAKTVVKTPKRQAQIDAIEIKVDNVLAQISNILPASPATSGSASSAGKDAANV